VSTISVSASSSNPLTRSNLRYHILFEPVEGKSIEEVRSNLKKDFLENIIPYSQKSFICPISQIIERDNKLLDVIYKAISSRNVNAVLTQFTKNAGIIDGVSGKIKNSVRDYYENIFNATGHEWLIVRNPIRPIFVDNTIAVVEDYFSSGISSFRSWSQITLYRIDEDDKIDQIEIFDNNDNSQQEKLNLLLTRYYKAVNNRDFGRLKEIFNEDSTIFDPIGKPSKNIFGAYSPLFSLPKFRIDTDTQRTYFSGDQVALVSFVTLTLPDFRSFHTTPIQVFKFVNDRIKDLRSFSP